MRFRFWSALIFLFAFVSGCAVPPQMPINLAEDYFSAGKAKAGKVGVIMSELPKPDTAFPGAGCLLCLAVANATHSSLTTQVQSFSVIELKPLPSDLVGLLKKQGIDAVLIEDAINVNDLPNLEVGDSTNKSRKDFSSLKTKHNVNRLLVVNIIALGVWRSYSAYFPTDPPRAIVNGNAAMIDLTTHTLEWFRPLNISRAS